MTFFLLWSYFVPEIFQFPYYANLVTGDIISCASKMVWHKINNVSTNNKAMLLKLDRHVAPYKIYQLVHILMLLWQHAQFQSPASSKLNTQQGKILYFFFFRYSQKNWLKVVGPTSQNLYSQPNCNFAYHAYYDQAKHSILNLWPDSLIDTLLQNCLKILSKFIWTDVKGIVKGFCWWSY